MYSTYILKNYFCLYKYLWVDQSVKLMHIKNAWPSGKQKFNKWALKIYFLIGSCKLYQIVELSSDWITFKS